MPCFIDSLLSVVKIALYSGMRQAEAAELIDELVTPITLRSIAPELHPDQ